MSITKFKNVDLSTLKVELKRILTEGIEDPEVRRLTETAVKGNEDPIRKVYDFVKENFSYLPDPYTAELFIHPKLVASDYFQGRLRSMDCDDFALLGASMLGSIGFHTQIVLLDYNFDNIIDHAVAEIYSEKLQSWVTFDPTSDYPLGWDIKASRKVVV